MCARVITVLSGGCGRGQIAERDVRILRVLGRGASSVVRTQCCVVPALISPEWSSDSHGVRQVYKGYYQRGNCFVAVKKINCFEKVRSLPLCAHPRSIALLPTQHQQTHATIRLV